eukprot:21824-Rhodomonas_salina.2
MNGIEALQLLETAPSLPDLILLDVMVCCCWSIAAIYGRCAAVYGTLAAIYGVMHCVRPPPPSPTSSSSTSWYAAFIARCLAAVYGRLLLFTMPQMSGYEVCQKLREKYSRTQLPVQIRSPRTRSSIAVPVLTRLKLQ